LEVRNHGLYVQAVKSAFAATAHDGVLCLY
jgi:hypothetical protein